MNAKIITATAAAFIALTSVASAAEGFFSDSQRDLQLSQQADKVSSAGGFITTSAIDPATSQRDAQIVAQADKGSLFTTHGGRQVYVTVPAIDPAASND